MIKSVNRCGSIFSQSQKCILNFTQTRSSFYNKYKHGPTAISNPEPDVWQWIKDFFGPEGLKFLKAESKRILYKPFGPVLEKHYEYNKTYIFEHFDSDESIKRWKPVADSDSFNGFSVSKFVRSPAGNGLFKGVLDNRLPDDGLTQNSGFVSVIGPTRPRDGLLQSENHWDWSEFNCFEVKFRGDGRRYNVVVNTGTYTNDLSYYDIHSFPLYTKGGPYWQTYRIPFSKFIFAYKGFVQDAQGGLPVHSIKFVSFVLSDTYDGPFALEIDYIGLRLEPTPFDEDSAYEFYSFPHIKYRPLQVDCPAPESAP